MASISDPSVPRSTLAFYDRGPGPAGYKLPPLVGKKDHALTHQIRPAYHFGLKSDVTYESLGPGPACVMLEKEKPRYDWTSYKYTMREKCDTSKQDYAGPGPAAYAPWDPDLIRNRAPAYTLHIRHRRLIGLGYPGPGAHESFPMIGPKIPTRIAAPECTMKSSRQIKNLQEGPGPKYDMPKVKPNGYTMRIKWPELSSTIYNASPASYEVGTANVWPGTPAWHFGNRYNDFTGIFRTECDKSSYEPLDSY